MLIYGWDVWNPCNAKINGMCIKFTQRLKSTLLQLLRGITDLYIEKGFG